MKQVRPGSYLPSEAWRRNQFAVNLATGLLFFGFTLVMPFMPFFVQSLGVHGPEVAIWSGVVLFTAPFLAALLGPFWGRLTDRYGMKIMLQRIAIAMVLHWLLMYFVHSLAHLMVLRVMLGVFSGFGTLSVALITHGVPQEHVGRVLGTHHATRTAGAALGPAVGGVLFDVLGFRLTFLVTAGICALGFLLVLVAYREIPVTSSSDTEVRRSLSFRELLSVPGVLTIIVLLFFANLVARSFSLVMPLFLQELAGPAAALGALSGAAFSLGAFADTTSSLALGRLSGRGRPRLWVLGSLVLGALVLFAMAQVVQSAWSLVILRAAYGFVAGGLVTSTYTLASGSIGQRSRATAYGILSGAAMLGASLGPLTSGFLAPWVGFRGLLAMGAGVLLVLAVVLAINAMRRPTLRLPAEREMPYVPLPR